MEVKQTANINTICPKCERQEKILEKIADGKTLKQIAEELRVSLSTVNCEIKKIDKEKLEEARQEAKQKAIEERQEKILEKIADGKTQTQIAKELGVSSATVSREIEKIDKQRLEEAKQKEKAKEKMQEKILKGIEDGKTQTQIAKELGISQTTVSREIAKQKPIEERQEAKQKAREEIQEKILGGIENGKTQTQIAEELEISVSNVNYKIKRIDKQKLEEAKQKAEDKIQEKILKAKADGKTQTQIARELGVSQSTVSREVAKQKEIEKRQAAKETAKQKAEDKIQEKILKAKADGKTQTQIARELGVSQSTVSREVAKQKEIEKRQAAKETAKQKVRERRQEKILKEIANDKKLEQIAKKLGVSVSTVSNEIRQIDSQKKEKAKQKAREKRQAVRQKEREAMQEAIKKGKENGKTQKQIAEELGVSQTTVSLEMGQMKRKNKREKITSENIEQKLKDKTITAQNAREYRTFIDEKYNEVTRKEVVNLLNAYVKTKQINEAIRFLNTLINNEDMQYLGKEKLIELKIRCDQIEKTQRARKMIRENPNIDIKQVAQMVSLRETQVIKIREDMLKNQGPKQEPGSR